MAVAKKTFTTRNPDSNDPLEGAFVQNGDDKFLILHLNDGESASTKNSGVEEGSPQHKGNSASDGEEARALPVSADAATKLKKQFVGEYNTFWNKLLWHIFHKMTPKNNRID